MWPGIARADVPSQVLSARSAALLQGVLRDDAIDCIYSATITLAESLRGIDSQLYSWATVKFYYCAFYSARCLLNLGGSCVYYANRSPFNVSATAGSRPTKAKGTTHKAVFDYFVQEYRGHVLLSQEIDQKPPLNWLMSQREEVNYRRTRFEEPEAPERFGKVSSHGVRKLLQQYLDDDQHLLTFDADHAMVSYPLHLWQLAVTEARNKCGSACFPTESARYLGTVLKDRHGPLAPIIGLLKDN